MHFASDNWSGAHPRIAENLTRHAQGFASAYGTSDLDKAVEDRFSAIFEREVAVFFVAPVRNSGAPPSSALTWASA